MRFFTDFGKGVSFHIRAFQFIAKHGLWAYFIYPVVIMAALWIFGFWSTFALGDTIADAVIELLGLKDSHEGWVGKLLSVLSFIIGLLLKVLLFFVFNSFLKFIVLIICSPIMALLSEKVDEINSGKKFPFSFVQLLKDIFRSILVTFRTLFFQSLIFIACMFIGWVPVIGWAVVPFLWMVGWYFLGFNMMDYTYERRKMNISEGAAFTRKHKGIAIGNGMVFSALLWIPFLGIALAPVVSAVAGTLATIDAMKEK
ncbi:MAG: EI24 domain-containing protein [Bacteroidota bacterium]|nr:EI24 domain-containing protein [Bacteroidota bacterium]